MQSNRPRQRGAAIDHGDDWEGFGYRSTISPSAARSGASQGS
jgi:hypothetical protein